ncbi:MAG: hypothetical protein WCE46_04580 [Methanoregula sp.]|uniref:hypothetical protein n=1 Tax=Methanoregula sp. TaxID=2052170 RepID=UPI003C751F7A
MRYNERVITTGVFRYDNKYAAPTKEQRERYMKGESEEHLFGPDDQIMLVVYDEAAYLKDDIDGTRVLFTGAKDKGKVYDEIKRLLDEHENKVDGSRSFKSGSEIE